MTVGVGGVTVGTGVSVGVTVGTGVSVGVTVGTGVSVGVTVGTGVSVGVTVGTDVEVGSGVEVDVGVPYRAWTVACTWASTVACVFGPRPERDVARAFATATSTVAATLGGIGVGSTPINSNDSSRSTFRASNHSSPFP